MFSYMAITFLACLQVTVSWHGISYPPWTSGDLLCLTSIILQETLAPCSFYILKMKLKFHFWFRNAKITIRYYENAKINDRFY